MKVSFINTVEDMVALNTIIKSSSSNSKAKIFFVMLIPLIATLGFVYDYYYLNKSFSYWYIIEFIFCLLWIIFFPNLGELSAKFFLTYRLKKTYFEPLTIQLTDEGLIKSSSTSIHKFEWITVKNIVTTNDYIFIHIIPNIGYSIPLKAFTSDTEKDLFISYLYKHVSN